MFRNFPKFVGIPKEVNPRFHKLMETIRISNMTDEQKKNYFKSSIDDDEREDIAQANFEYGKAEGRAEGRAEVAKNLLAMGLSPEQVSQATGLTDKEIMAIS